MCEKHAGRLRIAADATKGAALSKAFRVVGSAVSVAVGAWFLAITPVTVPALVVVALSLATVASVTVAVVMWRRSRAPVPPWTAARRPIAAIEAPKARRVTIDELLRETA